MSEEAKEKPENAPAPVGPKKILEELDKKASEPAPEAPAPAVATPAPAVVQQETSKAETAASVAQQPETSPTGTVTPVAQEQETPPIDSVSPSVSAESSQSSTPLISDAMRQLEELLARYRGDS